MVLSALEIEQTCFGHHEEKLAVLAPMAEGLSIGLVPDQMLLQREIVMFLNPYRCRFQLVLPITLSKTPVNKRE